MRRVLCVWFPNWPIQRQAALRPELERAAVVLHAERGSRGSYVVTCSEAAAHRGVRPGIPLAEAAALLGERTDRNGQSAGAPALRPHEPRADREALTELAVVCQRFTPRVALEAEDQPESLLLDIAGCEHLFGGDAPLAEEVAAELEARGYRPRVAIADTPGAAWALAHYGRRGDVAGRGTILPAGAPLPTLLSSLPAVALRLPPDLLHKLRRLGLATIGAILRLPRETLPARFGPGLL